MFSSGPEGVSHSEDDVVVAFERSGAGGALSSRARSILTCVSLWAAMVVCAGVLWHRPLVLAAIYATASVTLLAHWKQPGDWLMYACGFVLGPGGEIVAIYGGAWRYAETVWLIPAWLPPAWGMAALILLRLARAIGSEAPRT
ncbi:MAG: hypothetical protein ACE5GX_17885 [Thermoanaerobaculia bacterium]